MKCPLLQRQPDVSPGKLWVMLRIFMYIQQFVQLHNAGDILLRYLPGGFNRITMLIQQSPVTFDQPFGLGPCGVLQ
ncbi:hypothetical protein D3C73_1439520 [compost metagenome]